MLNKKGWKNVIDRLKNLISSEVFGVGLIALGSIALLIVLFLLLFLGKISPGVKVAGISLGGKAPEAAIQILTNSVSPPEKVVLTSNDQSFEIKLKEIDFHYEYQKSVQAAYALDKTGNILYDLWQKIIIPIKGTNIGLRLSLDEEVLSESLVVIAGQAAVEPVYPSAKLQNSQIVVEKGTKGQNVNIEELREEIGRSLAFQENSPITIPLKEVDPTLTDEEADNFKTRAENLINKTLYLTFEYETYTYKNSDVFSLLDPKGEYNEGNLQALALELAEGIDRSPQNSAFVFTDGRVNEFSPAKDGIAVKTETLTKMLAGNLRTLETTDDKYITVEIPYEATEPDVKTEDVNNLGIKELIGRGSSHYRGSISSRVYNLSLAASRFNGVLVAPGDVFSFNSALGDVSFDTGYKKAYIIKDGKTVLDDGGGVCQVSTTLFRAVLDAGLPVVERRAHAYRVGYYEQDAAVGFDATVYSPTTDFKFKNDTPGHLLIQTYNNPSTANLVFEIYGTSDGRIASTTKPIVTDVTPPPEDLYVDDPNLPAGTIEQIDWKAWGAKSRFTYTVERGGKTIYSKTFYSSYRPWQSIFLRGTGPAI